MRFSLQDKRVQSMIFSFLDTKCHQWYFVSLRKKPGQWNFLFLTKKGSQWHFLYFMALSVKKKCYRWHFFTWQKSAVNYMSHHCKTFHQKHLYINYVYHLLYLNAEIQTFQNSVKKFQDGLVEMTGLLLLPKLAEILPQNRARSSQTLLLSFSWQTLSSPLLQNNPQPAECQKWHWVVPHW